MQFFSSQMCSLFFLIAVAKIGANPHFNSFPAQTIAKQHSAHLLLVQLRFCDCMSTPGVASVTKVLVAQFQTLTAEITKSTIMSWLVSHPAKSSFWG